MGVYGEKRRTVAIAGRPAEMAHARHQKVEHWFVGAESFDELH